MNDRDKDKQEFIFGMKLKLNGQVQTSEGETSFEYQTNFLSLDLDSEENKKRFNNKIEKDKFIIKILRVLFLYYFVFASRSNPLDKEKKYDPSSELTYNPVENFDTQILPILKGDDDQAKKNLFINIKKGFETINVKLKFNKLKKLLIDCIKKTKLFDTKPCTLKVSISQGILEKDEDKIIDSNQIFNDKLAKKEGLKYISVDDSSGIDKEELCSLSVEIKFNDIQYFRSIS